MMTMGRYTIVLYESNPLDRVQPRQLQLPGTVGARVLLTNCHCLSLPFSLILFHSLDIFHICHTHLFVEFTLITHTHLFLEFTILMSLCAIGLSYRAAADSTQ